MVEQRLTNARVWPDAEPYDYHQLWDGGDPSEPLDLQVARWESTARWYASRCPAWTGSPTYTTEGAHLIERVSIWPYGVPLVRLPAVEMQAHCALLRCNWAVRTMGDDCEARLERAIQEHLGV